MHRPSTTAARFARTAFTAGVAILLAACDLMVASASPTPSRPTGTPGPSASETSVATDEVPTIRPEASGQVDLIGAADALADLRSYRVSISAHGLVPSSAADGRVTMSSVLVQGDTPAAEFTMTGVGGFEGIGSGPLHAIVIGDRAWLRSGSGRWTTSVGGAADFDALFTTLSPSDLVSGFEGLGPAFEKIGAERKNGRATSHYRVESSNPAASDGGLTAGSVDAWIADSGGVLIALAANGTLDVDGTPTDVVLTIDVTRIDDPANRVRPPA